MVKEIISGNYFTLVSIIFSFVIFIKNGAFLRRTSQLFFISTFVFLILTITECCDYYLSSFETLNNAR